MKRFTLTIECENTAFEPTPGSELGAILGRLAEELQADAISGDGSLYDSNGNRVGRFEFHGFDGEEG